MNMSAMSMPIGKSRNGNIMIAFAVMAYDDAQTGKKPVLLICKAILNPFMTYLFKAVPH